MPKKQQHPNSLANLAKSYGGKGGFDTETARKAGSISTTKAKATRKLRDEVNRELVSQIFDEASNAEVLAKIRELALEGNADMLKLYAKIAGMDKTDLEVSKAKKDIKKTEKETKRIEVDTKRIEAETEILRMKLVTDDDAEDDGFIDAIEGRLPDVWGGDEE